MMGKRIFLLFLCLSFLTQARNIYVSPSGRIGAAATRSDPTDITSVIQADSRVRPGDRIILLEGVYKHLDRSRDALGYRIYLKGLQDRPVVVAGDYGKRVIIDGGIRIESGSQYLILRDLEIITSENFIPQNRVMKNTGSQPIDRQWPWGGLEIRGGYENKYINLVIHDNSQGIGFWKTAKNSEIYGCIIYNNGWSAPDRKHGHAIYCQNNEGYKNIQDCILTGGYGYTMHGWVEKPDYHVYNIKLEGNIVYESNGFLVGGLDSCKDILLTNNYFYKNKQVELGYHGFKGQNENCMVLGNLFIDTPLVINNFKEVKRDNNEELNTKIYSPAEPYTVVIRKNKYDPKRAHIVICNWNNNNSVPVDLSSVADEGDEYRLVSPTDFYGTPIQKGVYEGQSVQVPVKGVFRVLVALIDHKRQ